MHVLDAVMLAAFVFARYDEALQRHIRARWHFGIGEGVCAWASHAIALWAMTKAPVAALRETSVIFGTVLAAVVLKGKFSYVCYDAAFPVCAEAVSLKVF